MNNGTLEEILNHISKTYIHKRHLTPKEYRTQYARIYRYRKNKRLNGAIMDTLQRFGYEIVPESITVKKIVRDDK